MEHEVLALGDIGSNSVDRMGSALQRAWLKKKAVVSISPAENRLPTGFRTILFRALMCFGCILTRICSMRFPSCWGSFVIWS